MNKYQNGKIYKIVNDVNNEIYVGSTVQKYLCSRMNTHRMDGRESMYKLYVLMRDLGMEHFKIVLIENFPCLDRDTLLAREDYWMNNLNASLNINNALSTIDSVKKSKLKYYTNNKHKQKEIYENNKEKILNRQKLYREKNKKIIQEKQKVYREKKKAEKLSRIIE
jgi:hypothetical protein